MPKSDDYREVFSTTHGRLCPECGKSTSECRCAEKRRSTVLGDGTVKVRRETKGRGGKTVTTISGLALNQEQLKTLSTDLKRACGVGGAVKDGVIEIQGDRCEQLLSLLAERGIKAKRSGG